MKKKDHLRKVRTGDLTSLTRPGKVRRESETKIQKQMQCNKLHDKRQFAKLYF
jgi:hypothetical protein